MTNKEWEDVQMQFSHSLFQSDWQFFEFVTEPSEVGKIDLKNLADSFRLIGKRSDNSSVFIIKYLHLWWPTLLRDINLKAGKEFT